MENVIIIGSGPAGLTAAIYTARASLQPLLIEGPQPGGQLTQTTDIENFPGFAEPVGGFDLMMNMRQQAERMGVRLVMDELVSCDLSATPKRLQLASQGSLEARTVIIATGASARYLGLTSEEQLKGHGVSGCATCDGAFYRGKRVAVVGGGDTAMEDALYLSRIVSHVTLIHRRDKFRASPVMADRVLNNGKITVVWNSVVTDVLDVAQGRVTGLRLRHVATGQVSEMAVDGLFLAVGHTPNTTPFRGQITLDHDGYIVAERTRTNIPGVYAAGDVQDRTYRQAITAAGTGCMAALEAERFLTELG
ncbi:MAG: thioredoxin-disulfide reductase [Kiritimatiellia bacterium]